MSTIILSDVTAFIAALLFAVHPIHTEAVSTTKKNVIINSHSNIHPNMHLLLCLLTFTFFTTPRLFSAAAAIVNARSQTMTFKEPENLIFFRHESQQQQQRYTENKKNFSSSKFLPSTQK